MKRGDKMHHGLWLMSHRNGFESLLHVMNTVIFPLDSLRRKGKHKWSTINALLQYSCKPSQVYTTRLLCNYYTSLKWNYHNVFSNFKTSKFTLKNSLKTDINISILQILNPISTLYHLWLSRYGNVKFDLWHEVGGWVKMPTPPN